MIEKYSPIESTQLMKGRKLAGKRGLDMWMLKWGITQLAQDIPLPGNWKDHQLKGNMKRFREWHIKNGSDNFVKNYICEPVVRQIANPHLPCFLWAVFYKSCSFLAS